MQAYNARPAFSRLGGRVLNRRLEAHRTARGFCQSSYSLQDEKSDAPAAPAQGSVPKRIERTAQAADQVQRLYNATHSRRPSGPPPVRRPPPDESGLPSGTEWRSWRPQSGAVDLRSLGATGQQAEKPVLRPRSSHPASRPQQASRGPFDAGSRQPGGGRRRSGEGGGGGRGMGRSRGPRRDEEGEEEDADTKAAKQANRTEGDRLVAEWERAELKEREQGIPYIPAEETMDTLREYLPRMPLSETGSPQLLTSRLRNMTDPISAQPSTRIYDLANRLRSGGYVYFRDEEEKAAVMEQAQKGARKSAERKAERTGQVVEPILPEFEPLGNSSRAVLEQEVLEGKYPDPAESMQHGGLDKIIHLIRKNSTYKPHDEAAILQKLGALIQPPPTAVPNKPTAKPRKKTKQAD